MRYCSLVIVAALVALFPLPGRADRPLQSLESIQAAAERYIRSRLEPQGGGPSKLYVTADNLDPRLRLQQCQSDLEAFQRGSSNSGPRAAVAVRCPSGAQWTIYVSLTIETEQPVLVLRRAVARGAKLGAGDVTLQPMRVKGVGSSYLTSIDQIHRRHAKRPLSAGSVLSPDMLAADILIKRGQEVMLVATVAGIEVRSRGIALTDGGADSRVRVQNLSSHRVVEGVVDGASVVRVVL